MSQVRNEMKKYVVFLLVLAAGTTGYFMKSEEETMGEYALADRLKVTSAEYLQRRFQRIRISIAITMNCVKRRDC